MDDFKPEVGFEFHFQGGKDGKSFRHICVVREVIAGKKLSYGWRYDNYPGDSLVVWELISEFPDRTTVRLTHTGLDSFPASMKDFAGENFSMGWNEIVGNLLKKFVEERYRLDEGRKPDERTEACRENDVLSLVERFKACEKTMNVGKRECKSGEEAVKYRRRYCEELVKRRRKTR